MRLLKTDFTRLLLGSHLKKLRNTGEVLGTVYDQESFDELFSLIFHHERSLVLRTADCVEKITREHPEYLIKHKGQILKVMRSADHKELKWHITPLVTRLNLTKEELEYVWHTLTYWALNPNESRIIRVNALQGLFDISRMFVYFQDDFIQTLSQVGRELIPSMQARVRKLKRLMAHSPGYLAGKSVRDAKIRL